MTRHCGECTLCCRLLPIASLGKAAGERCRHQSHKGCAVYQKADFPRDCAFWSCRWLVDPGAAAARLHRPDRVHYVIDLIPDLVGMQDNDTGAMDEIAVIQVWCDPAFPEAWRDPALIAYAEAEEMPMIVRFDNRRAVFVVPPALSNGKGLIVMDSNLDPVPSATGSRLLDRLI